jgi:hypothetical protein
MPFRPQHPHRHAELDYQTTSVGGAPLRVRVVGKGATNYRNAHVVRGAYYRLPDPPPGGGDTPDSFIALLMCFIRHGESHCIVDDTAAQDSVYDHTTHLI